MNLDEAQRKTVAQWIAQGLKLSDIQSRLASELGVKMTYMDVRFLVDDLKLTPKDVERPKPASSPLEAPPAAAPAAQAQPPGSRGAPAPAQPAAGVGGGGVSLQVDTIARPGSVVSGKVTFSDGNKA